MSATSLIAISCVLGVAVGSTAIYWLWDRFDRVGGESCGEPMTWLLAVPSFLLLSLSSMTGCCLLFGGKQQPQFPSFLLFLTSMPTAAIAAWVATASRTSADMFILGPIFPVTLLALGVIFPDIKQVYACAVLALSALVLASLYYFQVSRES